MPETLDPGTFKAQTLKQPKHNLKPEPSTLLIELSEGTLLATPDKA